MKYILTHLIHFYIIHNAIVFGSFELIFQHNNTLIPLNATVICSTIVFNSFESTYSL